MWKFCRMVFTVPSAYVQVWIVPKLCTWIAKEHASEPAAITRVRSHGVVLWTGPAAWASGTSTRASIAAMRTFFIVVPPRSRICRQDHKTTLILTS